MEEKENKMREAQEVFIHMHRNYRASRNIRAHWLFHHLEKAIRIDSGELDKDDEYSKEMTVIGIIPKGGDGSEDVTNEEFLVTVNTKVTYISRYYRHVFVLDLSPSTIVADDDSDCCLSSRLMPTLKNAVKSATKKFRVPGTSRIIQPQVYMTVCVFVPFLRFEHELTLIQGVFLTETNVDVVLDIIEEKFDKLFKSLYQFALPSLAEWGQQKRRYKNTKFESTCENNVIEDITEELYNEMTSVKYLKKREKDQKSVLRSGSPMLRSKTPTLMNYPRRSWKVPVDSSENVISTTAFKRNGKDYIHPEWSLIFMLRIGLIATQMLPENTQSNLIVITDSVCGMPDSNALQQVLTQLRSYTIACSFIQLQRKTCSEPVFGHVGSCELFHFLTMATFGTYLPKHRSHACCANLEDLHEHKSFDEATEESDDNLNAFHRALVCWSFQKALGDNAFMENAFTSINPEFVSLQRRGVERHRRFMTTYHATLNQLMYVRLREGFTLKSTMLNDEKNSLTITLCLAFRPLVFIEYVVKCPWPIARDERQNIQVELIIEAPYNELKDLLTEGQYLDPERMNLTKSAIDQIIEADRLLIHIHSFDTQKNYYTIPSGVTIDYALFGSYNKNARRLPPICMARHDENSTRSFIGFWKVLLELNDNTWQKWVHTHCERILLTVPDLPFEVFNTKNYLELDCSKALHKLHALIKSQSTFCLVNGHTYVSLVYGVEGEENSKPDFFYMKRICNEAPVVVIKTAFLGGISSSIRRKVVEDHRNRLRKLRFDTTPSELESRVDMKSDANRPRLDTDKENVLSVIRRPLERMIIRYTDIPLDLQYIVRVDEKTTDDEEIKLITLHNAISKFLSCRRSIVLLSPNQKEGGAYMVRHLADYIMNVIMQKRVHTEKFKTAWTNNNIISVCRQVCNSGGTTLEQFIMFPSITLAISGLKRSAVVTKNGSKMPNAMPTKKTNRPLAIISEFWYESETLELVESPNKALNNKSVEERLNDDLYITSMLFTLDRVLKLCGSCIDPMNTQNAFKEWTSEMEEDDIEYELERKDEGCRNLTHNELTSARNSEKKGIQAIKASPFVTVYSNLFDLSKLVEHSKRRLTSIKPFVKEEKHYSQCNTFILSSLHEQLSNICDATWIVNSEENEKICKSLFEDTNFHNLQLRVYSKGVTPWMIGLIFVPDLDSTFENDSEGVPIVILTCNEAQLAYCVATQNFDEKGIVNVPITAVPTEWFANVRVGWRSNNRVQLPESTITFSHFADYITARVMSSTRVGAMFEAAKMGVEVDEQVIAQMDNCFYGPDSCFHEMEYELQSVPPALAYLCEHLQVGNNPPEPGHICSQQSNIESMFKKVLYQNFAPVLGSNCLFYMKPVIPKHKKRSVKIGNEYRLQLNSRRSKEISIPLFVQFNCSVKFPNSMDSFEIDFLPSCIYQVLEKCKQIKDFDYPTEPFDVRDVEVNVELIVRTSQILEDRNEKARNEISDQGYRNPKEYMKQARQVRFRSQKSEQVEEVKTNMKDLPKKERKAVNDLLQSIDILLELEKILIESRSSVITVEKLEYVRDYIDKAYNADVSVGFNEHREKNLQFVIDIDGNRSKYLELLDGLDLGYTTLRRVPGSDFYYCCKVENIEVFKTSIDCDETNLGKDLLFDFWIIVTIEPISPEFSSEERINIYFCQRYNRVHSKILDVAWEAVRHKLRCFNQQLLFDRMFETRECDKLFIDYAGSNEIDDTELSQSRVEPQSPTFDDFNGYVYPDSPGYFACPLRKQMWFPVHQRLRDSSRLKNSKQSDLSQAFLRLHNSLQAYGVRNVPNTYIVRDDRKNVMMYMQLHKEYSTYKRSIKNSKYAPRKKYMLEREEQLKTEIAMTVFAIEEPDPEFLESFAEMVRQKLNTIHVDEIVRSFWNNRDQGILLSEVEFIQPSGSSPYGRSFFSIPQIFAQHRSALFFYVNQHLETLNSITSAKVRSMFLGKSGSSASSLAAEEKKPIPKFKPMTPYSGTISEQYNLSTFHFHLKRSSIGVNTVGIGLIEMRMVSQTGEVFEKLEQPKMDEQSHAMFVPKTPGDNSLFHRDITKIQRFDEPKPGEKSICGYLEVNLWKQGDIESASVDTIIHDIFEKSMYDVITEFGYLNTQLLQSPMSFLKQPEMDHSFDGLEPTPFYQGEKPEPRRSSFGGSYDYTKAAITRMSVVSRDADSGFGFSKNDYINPRTAYDIINWFKFVESRHGETNSVIVDSVRFDCQHALLTPLFEIRNRIEYELGGSSAEPHENIFLCGLKTGESEEVSRGSSFSLFSGNKTDAKFEVLMTDPFVGMTGDIGVDEHAGNRSYLIVSYMKNVFTTNNQNTELTTNEVEERQKLFRNHLHAKYEPKITTKEYISRQRVMFAIMRGDIMDVYFYNYHPKILKDVRTKIQKVAGWHNAKTRLLRDIGLHKMGTTHFSNFDQTAKEGEYDYERLIWSDPTQLIAKEYPPDYLGNKTIADYPEYSNIFYRMYRQPNLQYIMGRSRFYFKSDCVPTNHYEQMLRWRDGLSVKLKKIRKITETHDEFLRGKRELREDFLHEFFRAPKAVTKQGQEPKTKPEELDEETMSMTEKTSKRASMFGENSIKSFLNVESEIFKKRGKFVKKIILKPEPAANLVKEFRSPLLVLDCWRQAYKETLQAKPSFDENQKDVEEQKEEVDPKRSKSSEKLSVESGSSGGLVSKCEEQEVKEDELVVEEEEAPKVPEEVVEKKKNFFGSLVQRIRNSPKPEPSSNQPSTSQAPAPAVVPPFVTVPHNQRAQQGAFSKAKSLTMNAASKLVRPFRRNSHREAREIVLQNEMEQIETGENALEIMENEQMEEMKREEEKIVYVEPPMIPILYFHANEFLKYMMEEHEFFPVNVTHMSRRSMALNRYSTKCTEKCKNHPYLILAKTYEGGIIFVDVSYDLPEFVVRLFVYERAAHSTADYYMTDKMIKLYSKETLKLNNEVTSLSQKIDLKLFDYDFNLRVIGKHLIDVRTKGDSIFGLHYNISDLLDSVFKYNGNMRTKRPLTKCSIEKETYECTRIKNEDFWLHFIKQEECQYLMLKMKGQHGVEYMLVDFEDSVMSSTNGKMKQVFQLVSFLPRYLSFESQFLPYYTMIVHSNEDYVQPKTPLMIKRSIEESQLSASPRPSTSFDKDSNDQTQDEYELDENDPNCMNLPEKRQGKFWKRKFSGWSFKNSQEKKNRIKWMDREVLKKTKKQKSLERKQERRNGCGITPENSEEDNFLSSESNCENYELSRSQSEPNITDVTSEEVIQLFSSLPKSDDEDVDKMEKRRKLLKKKTEKQNVPEEDVVEATRYDTDYDSGTESVMGRMVGWRRRLKKKIDKVVRRNTSELVTKIREKIELVDSDEDVLESFRAVKMKNESDYDEEKDSFTSKGRTVKRRRKIRQTRLMKEFRKLNQNVEEKYDEKLLLDKRTTQEVLETESNKTASRYVGKRFRLRIRMILENFYQQYRFEKPRKSFRSSRNRQVRNLILFRQLRSQMKFDTSDESEYETEKEASENESIYECIEDEREVEMDFKERASSIVYEPEKEEIPKSEPVATPVKTRRNRLRYCHMLENIPGSPSENALTRKSSSSSSSSSSSPPLSFLSAKINKKKNKKKNQKIVTFNSKKRVKRTYMIRVTSKVEEPNPWDPCRLVLGRSVKTVKKLLRTRYRIELSRLEPIVKLLIKNVNSARLCHYMLIRYGLNQCTFHEHVATNQRIMLVRDPKNAQFLFAIDCTFFNNPNIHLVNIETEKNSASYTPLSQFIRQFVLTLASFVWVDMIFRPIKSKQRKMERPISLEHFIPFYTKNQERIITKLLVSWRKTRKLD